MDFDEVNSSSFRNDPPLPPFQGDRNERPANEKFSRTASSCNPSVRESRSAEKRRFSYGLVFGRVLSWCAAFVVMLMGLCFMFLLVGAIFLLKTGGAPSVASSNVVEKTLSGSSNSQKKIVVLPIEGTITENESGFVREAIQKAYEDERLSGLILRVNSPGGTISGSDYYYKLLREVKNERKIPVYVSMGGIAASGGYYVSMVADKVFAERSTLTGSIGVIAMMFDASDLCQKLGVKSNYIVSGKNKGMGDMTKPMSAEEREIWQGLINESYEQFLSVVREGRSCFANEEVTESGSVSAKDANADSTSEADNAGTDDAAADDSETAAAENNDAADHTESGDDKSSAPKKSLREIADGRVYSAMQAKDLGLVDEIGFLQDAVDSMIKDELKTSESEVEVVRYKKSEGILDILTAEQEVKSGAARLNATIETMTVPTLYYITPGAFPVN